MIEVKTAIIACVIHLGYYAYFQIISDIMRIGMVHNTPNSTISHLRTEFKVNIKTFQRNSTHYGFAWIKSIYINENLFKRKRALMWTFFHELRHLKRKHKAKTLWIRFFFSLTPLVLIFFHWTIFVIVYVGYAYGMEYIRKVFERNADLYANKMFREWENVAK